MNSVVVRMVGLVVFLIEALYSTALCKMFEYKVIVNICLWEIYFSG